MVTLWLLENISSITLVSQHYAQKSASRVISMASSMRLDGCTMVHYMQ
jgi:hypothetical protein